MVQKRQLTEEEYDVSPKHLKLENSCQLVSFLEFPTKDAPLRPDTSGKPEGCFSKQNFETDDQFESHKLTYLPGRSSATSEEIMTLDSPANTKDHNPLKPRTLIHPEDTYTYLLESPPLKEVPIGSEYQADLPEWRGYSTKSMEDNNIKFIGSCISDPLTDPDPAVYHNVIGRGRIDCSCENPGSCLCVQQHIGESRENLKRNIGNKRFLELGFENMGDIVAYKWTEEDEQLFHEVIFSNPASLGRNFWNRLAESFPSRTRQEIVSYYFNVFMLQKRAEQNRSDPRSADSDDDEWQGSATSDDDDDVDDVLCRDEIQEYGFSVKSHVFDYYNDTDFLDGDLGSSQPSDQTPVDESGNTGFLDGDLGSSQPSDRTPVHENGGDYDFQDDSCTSSSDSKVWDVGYFSFSRNKNDFLPTGSMIEEVFGVNSWNFKVADDGK